MISPEAFAEDLSFRAGEVLADGGARRETFAIGSTVFELVAPAGLANDWLGRAFTGAAAAEPPDSPLHRLLAWSGTHRSTSPPERPWGPSDHEPLGIVQSFTNERVRCAFDVHTSSLIVSDGLRDASYTWYPDISSLPAWAKASPFRIPLSWLLNRNGMQMVHGAAVAMGARAALLAGAGGAGKSTTALACALEGMGYLGDDYCAIEPDAGKVHRVYCTAKVLPATLTLLPALRPMLVNPERIDEEKGVIFLEEGDVPLVASADLKSLLLPRFSEGASTSFSPASRSEAIRAILPSTVGGLMGGTAVTPRHILKLVQQVPAFHLDLGTDPGGVVSAIAAHLSEQ